MLGHHFVSKRSIYFILDNTFSPFQLNKLRSFILMTFKQMKPADHFGLMTLDDDINSQLELEEISFNTQFKQKLLEDFAD